LITIIRLNRGYCWVDSQTFHLRRSQLYSNFNYIKVRTLFLSGRAPSAICTRSSISRRGPRKNRRILAHNGHMDSATTSRGLKRDRRRLVVALARTTQCLSDLSRGSRNKATTSALRFVKASVCRVTVSMKRPQAGSGPVEKLWVRSINGLSGSAAQPRLNSAADITRSRARRGSPAASLAGGPDATSYATQRENEVSSTRHAKLRH